MFGRKRRARREDVDHQYAGERKELREIETVSRRVSLGVAKSEFIAGRISLDELWPFWWDGDIRHRPVASTQTTIETLVRESMELERSRLIRQLAPLPRSTNTKEP